MPESQASARNVRGACVCVWGGDSEGGHFLKQKLKNKKQNQDPTATEQHLAGLMGEPHPRTRGPPELLQETGNGLVLREQVVARNSETRSLLFT